MSTSPFLQSLIAYAYHKILDQRSPRSFFFILQGKKSVQAIQDTKLFGLEKFYHVLPTLDFKIYEQSFQQVKQEKYANKNITEAWFYLHLKNYEILQAAEIFMERLQLFIQVLSHWQKKQNQYMPMIRKYDVQVFVKKLFYEQNLDRTELCVGLYKELYEVCMEMPTFCREILLNRQMGAGYHARTFQQLSESLKMDIFEVQLTWQSISQFIYQMVDDNQKKFPSMARCISQQKKSKMITQSAEKTKAWMNKGKSIDEICRIRRMKRGTIEAHIIEMAVQDASFPIENFMSAQKIMLVLEAARYLQSFRLKALKDYLGETFSYFEIRLALTKRADENEFNA